MIKRLLLTLGLMLAIASAGHAQGLPYQLAPPAPGATMRVCVFAAGLPNPCPVLASIFNDAAETSPVPNPLLLGDSGNPLFFLSPGPYVIQLTGTVNQSIVFVLGGGGSSGSVPFSSVTAGTNAAALVVGTGGSLGVTGTGTITATAVPFSGVTSATNTTAVLHVGTGASLDATGSGTITATNGLSGLTAGFIPKAASASTATNSLCDEGITTANVLTCTDSGGLAIQQALIGASPPSFTAGSGFAIGGTEGSAPTGASGLDIPYMDSTLHAFAVNNNNTGNMALSRTVCANVTPVTVAANTTNDQLLQACSLSANALNVVGHTLKVTTAGVFSTNAASTASLTFKVKLCTVSGCGSGTVITPLNATTGATAALSATNLQFLESGYIVTQTAGAASSYEAQGSLTIDTSATATVSESIYPAANTATVGTIDSTGALFIQVTAAASAGSTNNSFTGRQLIVELVN